MVVGSLLVVVVHVPVVVEDFALGRTCTCCRGSLSVPSCCGRSCLVVVVGSLLVPTSLLEVGTLLSQPYITNMEVLSSPM